MMFFPVRPFTITRAPSRASPVAIASPMPFVEPETNASLSVSCRSIVGKIHIPTAGVNRAAAKQFD
jgi:hypothetical protein